MDLEGLKKQSLNIINKTLIMFKLKNLILSSSLLFSIFSTPVFSNPKVLKVGAIPDQNQDVLDKRFNLFSKELSKQLDVEVKYIPVINYVAAVTGFRTKDLDLVWFGGLSGVQARLQTPNSIVIAQRAVSYTHLTLPTK